MEKIYEFLGKCANSPALLAAPIVIVVLLFGSIYWLSVDSYTVTVTDKERIVQGHGKNINSKYLIYTDKRTFELTDTILFFRWNSSDEYGKIIVNKTYNVEAAGWRIPFLSVYENIINIKEVK